MAEDPARARTFRTSDGVPYRIRPLRPDDAGRERAFIQGLSPQSRYQRFMHYLREPSDELVGRLVNVDHQRTVALAAVIGEGDGERIIGVARYSADNDRECEFAVVVADEWQCRGIGTTLTPMIFDCAARAGFEMVYGTVLADNQRMIELAQWLGLTVEAPRPGEPTVRAWRRLRVKRAVTGGWLAAVTFIIDPGALLLLAAANATPVIAMHLFGQKLGAPVDALFRRHGKPPLFGAHKTWRGLAAGALACALVGAWLPCGPWIGLGFGLLALAGDLASSYVKRRMHWPSGRSAPLLDQLPESLLPLIVFATPLALGAPAILGTAAAFTLLDMLSARWRVHPRTPRPST